MNGLSFERLAHESQARKSSDASLGHRGGEVYEPPVDGEAPELRGSVM